MVDPTTVGEPVRGDDAAMTYRIHRLDPASPDLPFLAGQYAALSLRALLVDPAAFGVAYATAAAWSPADWRARMTRPGVHIFIGVADPGSDQSGIDGAWVGMLTQLGPTPKDTFWLKESGAPEPRTDDVETHWHQTATWVDPAHRGRRLARRLIDAAVSFAAASINGTVQQTRIRALTTPRNAPSQHLYTTAGFAPVGRCTIDEAMAANGNADVPFHGRTDWPAAVRAARAGVVLERVVDQQQQQQQQQRNGS